jgi:hypothetical protein
MTRNGRVPADVAEAVDRNGQIVRVDLAHPCRLG